jgi:hypothetical protein
VTFFIRVEAMPTSRSRFPNRRALVRGLTAVLSAGTAEGPVAVIERQRWGQGTFPKEVVTCRLADGRELRLFCKYGSEESSHNSHGHRGGVAYEAEVYRRVLQRCPSTTPRFYGTYTRRAVPETWLVLAYLDKGVRAARTTDSGAMTLAARWIGEFHAVQERCLCRAAEPSLLAYDADYYLGWARRTDRFAGERHREYGWLAPLCARFGEAVELLREAAPTVIHGEYYPAKNILYSAGAIYPIDWESAAVAAGEIDLATLTEGWGPKASRECAAQYRRSRWPNGGPADFERRLAAARLYLAFRWLGEEPAETIDESNRWRFDDLRAAGEHLGLI